MAPVAPVGARQREVEAVIGWPPHRSPAPPDLFTRDRPRTLPELLHRAAARYGDAIAVHGPAADGDALEAVTYHELTGRADACAAALCGLDAGASILLGGRASASWIAALYAIGVAGGTAVPVDADAPVSRVEEIAARTRAVAAVGDARFLARCPLPLARVRLGALAPPGAGVGRAAGVAPAPTDVAVVLFTAGTTGPPKGVMITHDALVFDAAGIAAAAGIGPGDRVFVPLPLHHGFALTVAAVAAIGAGVRVELEPRPRFVASRLRAARPTVVLGVPLLFESVFRQARRRAHRNRARGAALVAALALNRRLVSTTGINGARLIAPQVRRALGGRVRYAVSGAAALPPALSADAAGWGIPLIQGYGLTEAGPVVSVNRWRARGPWWSRRAMRRLQSVGTPLDGVRVRICALPGLPPGVGEILVAGRNLMRGYLGDAATTAAVLRDGWLHTGDLGRVEPDGTLWVTGRVSDSVSAPDGEQVPLAALDASLAALPEVAEACVVALTDPWRLVAVVRPGPRADPSGAGDAGQIAERVRTAVAARMRAWPPRERVGDVVLSDAPLPRDALGKLRRSAVDPSPRFDADRWRRTIAEAATPA